MAHNQSKGIGALVIAGMLYGLYGIYARFIGAQFDVFTQSWVKQVLVIPLTLLLIILFKQQWKRIAKKDAPWIIGWIICDILFIMSFFIAFNNLPIGITLFLIYAGITLTGFFAGTVLLKEKVTRIKLAAISLSLIGLFLTYGGAGNSLKLSLLLLAFSSGIAGGLWFILPKFIAKTYPKLQLIMLDAIGVFAVNLLFAQAYQQTAPQFSLSAAWISIVLYAITQIVAAFLVIYGFRAVEAQVGSLILPLEIVFGTVFAYFFFQETLTIITLLGGLCILMGAVLPNVSRKRLK